MPTSTLIRLPELMTSTSSSTRRFTVRATGYRVERRRRVRLEREIENLDAPFEGEPTCDALGGEPPLVRVNLRPFVADRGDPDLLLDAFVSSAEPKRGESRRMTTVLSLAASYVQCAGRGELAPELKELSAELAEKGYPAVHHSEAYVEAYHPAYRVVDEVLATEHGWCGALTPSLRWL